MSSSTPAVAPAWNGSASTWPTGHMAVRTASGARPSDGSEADLRFDRDGGWSGPGPPRPATAGRRTIGGLDLELRATEAGQVGCFPEHAAMLPWLRERVELRRATAPGDAPPVRVLHLFAYTGLATLAMAAAGAAVAHVDAARPAVAWARRNAAANGLDDAPIRWLVDDARAFVARERRRGNRYDGIVLDPPTYGHGASGRAVAAGDGPRPAPRPTAGRSSPPTASCC